RLDAGFASSNAPQDLSSTLRLVVNDFAARAAEPVPIDLVIDSDAVLVVPLNVDAFAIALTNLIHNARIHGAPNAPISVVAGPGPVVRVINGGPVVSSETLERLGQRFVRGDTRAKGSGLGLAIVQAIMVQMGGELKLLSPASARDDGFEAVLCFNTAGHDANADDASDDRRCGGSAAGVG
ncbi:MAG: HAMP domain-containing histidine kinase, partial [Alphaproteobacteria bacterium]|nr:HAMP domain-containing histidine kinase [Alphaproteobacteria bacterium]